VVRELLAAKLANGTSGRAAVAAATLLSEIISDVRIRDGLTHGGGISLAEEEMASDAVANGNSGRAMLVPGAPRVNLGAPPVNPPLDASGARALDGCGLSLGKAEGVADTLANGTIRSAAAASGAPPSESISGVRARNGGGISLAETQVTSDAVAKGNSGSAALAPGTPPSISGVRARDIGVLGVTKAALAAAKETAETEGAVADSLANEKGVRSHIGALHGANGVRTRDGASLGLTEEALAAALGSTLANEKGARSHPGKPQVANGARTRDIADLGVEAKEAVADSLFKGKGVRPRPGAPPSTCGAESIHQILASTQGEGVRPHPGASQGANRAHTRDVLRARDRWGRTALCWACARGNREVVQVCLHVYTYLNLVLDYVDIYMHREGERGGEREKERETETEVWIFVYVYIHI